MKTINATFLTHLGQPVTTTCLLVRVECVGAFAGTIYGFTDLDIDVAYDDGNGSVTYSADNGFSPKRVEQRADLSVDDSAINGLIADTGITEALVRSGIFNSAICTVYRINWKDLTSGRHEVVFHGRLGETEFSDMSFENEMRSLSQLLKQIIGQQYSTSCIATFGSSGVRWACNKAISWAASGTVTSVGTETQVEFTDTGRAEASGYFSDHGGVVEWLTGDNAGQQMEVSSFAADVFVLSLPLPYPIQVGDTYRPRLDCDKLFATCKDVHANTAYFRGQNLMPINGTGMIPGAEVVRA